MPKRKHTPVDNETQILLASGRRCCVCFALNNDFEAKQGEIAHLDHDPSNPSTDNLVWMCLSHHATYDGRTSQTKNLTLSEIKRYRKMLYDQVKKELPTRDQLVDIGNEPIDRQSLQTGTAVPVLNTIQNSTQDEIIQLLAKLQLRTIPLSQCITEILSLSQKIKDAHLARFCQNELSGYQSVEVAMPTYRTIEAFATTSAQINPWFIGWGNDSNAVINHMRGDKNFHPIRLRILQSVSEMESKKLDDSNALLNVMRKKAIEFDPKTTHPDFPVTIYTHADAFSGTLESIRQDLIRRLVGLLEKQL